MKKNTTLFILILSCIFTIILISAYLFNGIIFNVYKSTKETFENQESNVVVHSCPSSLKQFSDMNGDILCCEGDVNGHKCSGKVICAISANANNIPSCKIYRAQYLEEQGRKLCPASTPNYYENIKSGLKGCTYGAVNATGEAPASYSQKSCVIYNDMNDASLYINSCSLQKKLDSMYTPTSVTDKKLVKMHGGIHLPLATYIDDMKMPRQCIDKNNMKEYYSFLIKNAKTSKEKVDIEEMMNRMINKHVMVCENAQKVFIDKTVSKSEMMF